MLESLLAKRESGANSCQQTLRVAEGVVADGRGRHNSFPIGQDGVLHPAERLNLTETLTGKDDGAADPH